MDEEAELRELYAEFGMTAEKAQVLEVEAGNVALAFLALTVKPGEKVAADKREFFRQIVEDANRQNLGKLLRTVKSLGTYSDAILETIDTALERRNYLVHRFFPTHNFALFNPEGRAEMIKELQEIRYILTRAIATLTGVAGTLLAIVGHEGLSPEAHERLINEAKRIEI